MNTSRITVLIADDHAIIRRGLVELLREEFPMLDVTECSDSHEVFSVYRKKTWDFIMLDISMPGRNGIDVLKQLRADGILAPILILSVHPEEQYAIRVLKAGASGFVNKTAAPEELLLAVRKVLSGKKYITPSLAEILAENFGHGDKLPHELLSDRELQVMLLIATGKSVSAIADEISLSVNTVSTYRSRILEKMGMTSNAEITRYAIDNDLLD